MTSADDPAAGSQVLLSGSLLGQQQEPLSASPTSTASSSLHGSSPRLDAHVAAAPAAGLPGKPPTPQPLSAPLPAATTIPSPTPVPAASSLPSVVLGGLSQAAVPATVAMAGAAHGVLPLGPTTPAMPNPGPSPLLPPDLQRQLQAAGAIFGAGQQQQLDAALLRQQVQQHQQLQQQLSGGESQSLTTLDGLATISSGEVDPTPRSLIPSHPSPGRDGLDVEAAAAAMAAMQLQAGALPPSPTSSNKALYLGNLHPFVTEETLQEVFAGCTGITELKVIRDKNTNVSAGYGFAKFDDHASAAVALSRVNKIVLFGQDMRVNWAFQKEVKSDAASYVHVFVGDLAPDITDGMLLQAFEGQAGCCDARVMWDHATGRSRGYGFVSFRSREEADVAIQAMHGHFVGSKRVRCGWAQHKTDNIVQMDPQILDRADPTNTNVYVGNLAAHLTEANVKRQFSAYGQVAEVKLHRKGAYGFVRYETHEDAVRAIVCMNGQVLGGKQLKCSWGRHPNTPPHGVQASLMALAAASVGQLPPSAVPAPPLHAPGMAGAGAGAGGHLHTPQALHMGMPLGMPLAASAAQSIIQGQGPPLGMMATPGLMTADGELPAAMHALHLDASMYPYGMFYGGQQIR